MGMKAGFVVVSKEKTRFKVFGPYSQPAYEAKPNYTVQLDLSLYW